MATELSTKTDTVLPVFHNPNIDEKEFDKLVGLRKFLPYVQLYGSNSKLAKRRVIPGGNFGLTIGKDRIIDLGEKFDFIPVAIRPKAMDFSGKTVISVFDMNSPEYKRIAEQSEVKD